MLHLVLKGISNEFNLSRRFFIDLQLKNYRKVRGSINRNQRFLVYSRVILFIQEKYCYSL